MGVGIGMGALIIILMLPFIKILTVMNP
jgi:hypothetical protein